MATGSDGRFGAGVAVLLAAALSGIATPARAGDTEPIRVGYLAPAACPSEAAFIGQVVARTARARVAGPEEAARTFAITITLEGARARGRLTIADGAGPPAVRDVVGGTCEEVVSALALVTALAIDPRASTAPAATLPAPPTPAAPPPVEHGPPPPPYAALPWWGPIGAPLPVIPAAGPVTEPRWRAGWGMLFGGASALAPGIVFTLGGYAELARAGGGLLSPAFRLAMVQADSGLRAVDARQRARFALAAGRLEGCPIRVELFHGDAASGPAPELGVLPCMRVDVGELTASGLARVGLTRERPWVAVGMGGRVVWQLFGRLRLEAEVGVALPLVRDTFSFGVPPGPVRGVHAVPVAGGYFAAGVGTHFP